jgi:glycosyltransferase involved in cell wall biosynthesis
MNIVYYSYNFLPQADAESYCATRFAAALHRSGHNVTVITMDWDMQVSEKTYKALVPEDMRIIRLPFSIRKNTPLKGLLWYGHRSQMAVDVPNSVVATNTVLKSLEKPILITRTHPVMSSMVGIKSSKYADKWIAHFSDPIPWFGEFSDTIGHKFLKRQEMNIIRKAFMRADAISVTCMHVCKYFKDVYGDSFNQDKVFMTTHIGDYRLDPSPEHVENPNQKRILLHPGSIFARRGGLTIAKVMKELASENYDCQFVHVGDVENTLQNELIDSSNVKIYNTISPETSVELRKDAKAIFVPDFQSPLSYSPFILSKFVYQIMSDKPMVLYSKKDCEMHDYAVRYPEAGIFWAEADNVESLKEAIKEAMECDSTKINRNNIRKCFNENTIVRHFEESVQNICYGKTI